MTGWPKDRIAAHRAAVRAYVESLRDRIRHPGASLPERAWRKPASGIRREQAIRCPWCGRRELVFLDPRFGEWRFTCLACGGDAALRGWSRALAIVTDRFKLDARLLLTILPAIPWLLGMPVVGAFGLLAAVVFALFTATGYGQTRRLPGGAKPQSPGPT